MSYAANASDAPRHEWDGRPYRFGPPGWHPGLFIAMILGFIFWWPIGLAMLAYILWSKSMCRGYAGPERWSHKMQRMDEKMGRLREKMERFGGGQWGGPPSSGNRAFDEYRSDTLRRLEEEQREFKDFLERLRFAKDRAEFDQFMNERRGRGGSGPTEAPQQA